MTIRNISIALLLVSISVTSVALADTEVFSTYVNWSKGDVFAYKLVKTKQKSLENGSKTNSSAESQVRLEVLGKRGNLYDINWVIGKTKILTGPGRDDPTAQEFVNIMQGVSMQVVVDHEGYINDLKNAKEIRDAVRNLIDKLYQPIIDAEDMSEEEQAQLKELAMAPYKTKETTMAAILQDLAIYFAAHGNKLTPETYVEFQAELPNPFGGESFPATGTIKLENADKTKDTFSVLWTQSPDPDELARIMFETFSKIMKQRGVDDFTRDKLPPLTRINQSKYVFEKGTSALKSMETTTTIDLGTGRNIESMSYERY